MLHVIFRRWVDKLVVFILFSLLLPLPNPIVNIGGFVLVPLSTALIFTSYKPLNLGLFNKGIIWGLVMFSISTILGLFISICVSNSIYQLLVWIAHIVFSYALVMVFYANRRIILWLSDLFKCLVCFLLFVYFALLVLLWQGELIIQLLEFQKFSAIGNYLEETLLISQNNSDLLWNRLYGQNKNFISAFLTSLSPFVVYGQTGLIKHKGAKILVLCLIALMCLHSNSMGAVLALMFLCIFLLLERKKLKVAAIVSSAFLLLFLFVYLCVIFIGSNPLEDIIILSQAGEIGELGRIRMLKNSFLIWLDSPLVGRGLGTWQIHVSALTSLANDQFYISNWNNHNLFSLLLVETGIMGVLGLMIVVATVLKNRLFAFRKLKPELRAALLSSIIYLVLCNIYETSNSYGFYFSRIQLLFYMTLAMLIYSMISKKAI